MIKFHGKQSVEIEGFRFEFVQELEPERDDTGKIKEFRPQKRYKNEAMSKPHAHGKGSFCKFSISSEWKGRCGVYALFRDKELLYIGECRDLTVRFNSGYGNISPKNCFPGGQLTNCKINKMVLNEYLNDEKVALYFYEMDDYKAVEKKLIAILEPPHNDQHTHKR